MLACQQTRLHGNGVNSSVTVMIQYLLHRLLCRCHITPSQSKRLQSHRLEVTDNHKGCFSPRGITWDVSPPPVKQQPSHKEWKWEVSATTERFPVVWDVFTLFPFKRSPVPISNGIPAAFPCPESQLRGKTERRERERGRERSAGGGRAQREFVPPKEKLLSYWEADMGPAATLLALLCACLPAGTAGAAPTQVSGNLLLLRYRRSHLTPASDHIMCIRSW